MSQTKYSAYNMNATYLEETTCPYGCTLKLRMEQLPLHLTKCWRKDEVNFGHCKYNYFHIYPRESLIYHEENCTSRVDMTEDDFRYEEKEYATWIGTDELSLKFCSDWPTQASTSLITTPEPVHPIEVQKHSLCYRIFAAMRQCLS